MACAIAASAFAFGFSAVLLTDYIQDFANMELESCDLILRDWQVSSGCIIAMWRRDISKEVV